MYNIFFYLKYQVAYVQSCINPMQVGSVWLPPPPYIVHPSPSARLQTGNQVNMVQLPAGIQTGNQLIMTQPSTGLPTGNQFSMLQSPGGIQTGNQPNIVEPSTGLPTGNQQQGE